MAPESDASSLFRWSQDSRRFECLSRGPVMFPLLPTAPTEADENSGAVVA